MQLSEVLTYCVWPLIQLTAPQQSTKLAFKIKTHELLRNETDTQDYIHTKE